MDLNSLESANVWRYLGIKIMHDSEGRAGVHVKDSENLRQVYGAMHGGIISTAVDAAAGVVVNKCIGRDYAASTVELKVNYLLPVVNSDIFAYAKIVKRGKQLIVTTVEVFDDLSNVVAIGIVTYMVKSKG
ncbi:PaaI family thioesterase [Desulfosporosinus sp.]|uniref:PaaI family thioesterase n=1 Tax=Desulfosporosinus sp. TaxID=157907 RepID=UPI0025C66F36|nr:PaaI family thioesterase [Desulfosporosinus sp.]